MSKLGLALSGGGARGAFQVGVYEVLLRSPQFAAGPAVVSGTSAGAINAALIASGKTPGELIAFWHGLATDQPVDASASFAHDFTVAAWELVKRIRTRSAARTSLDALRKSWRFVTRRKELIASGVASFLELVLVDRFDVAKAFLAEMKSTALFDTARLRQRLFDVFGGNVVRPVDGRALAIQAVDAHAGAGIRYVRRADVERLRAAATTDSQRKALSDLSSSRSYALVDDITIDMVLASASIPILFPAVRINGRTVWDGGVLNNTPLAPLVDLGADQIVTVLVTETIDDTQNNFENLGDAIERVTDTLLDNTYNVDRKLMLERNKLPGYRAVTLFKAIRPPRGETFTIGSYLDFHTPAIHAMYEEGRRAATAWLADGPPEDRIIDEDGAPARPRPPNAIA